MFRADIWTCSIVFLIITKIANVLTPTLTLSCQTVVLGSPCFIPDVTQKELVLDCITFVFSDCSLHLDLLSMLQTNVPSVAPDIQMNRK